MRSAAAVGADSAAWQAPESDDAFLHAFATALVAPTVELGGDTVAVAAEQQLLLQAAAAAILDAEAPRATPRSAGGARRSSSSAFGGAGASARLPSGDDTAGGLPELPRMDFSELPNTSETRALREYAAQCETHVQLHQTRVRAVAGAQAPVCRPRMP